MKILHPFFLCSKNHHDRNSLSIHIQSPRWLWLQDGCFLCLNLCKLWALWLRGCLHDTGATFIPRWDEKLHCVYIKPCLFGCKSNSAVKLMKLQWIWNEQSYLMFTWHRNEFSCRDENLTSAQVPGWTRAGVTHTSMTFCGGIMYRAIRGNRGELVLRWKSPRYHVNTTLNIVQLLWSVWLDFKIIELF